MVNVTSNGTATGRAVDGRFSKGNRFGKGRPPRAFEAQYLTVLADAVGLDNWRAICERAVTDAKAGDAVARAWLAKYVVGEHPLTLAEVTAGELTMGQYWELVGAIAHRRADILSRQLSQRAGEFEKAEVFVDALCGQRDPDAKDAGLSNLDELIVPPWDRDEQTEYRNQPN
jgi:hypothetical protein